MSPTRRVFLQFARRAYDLLCVFGCCYQVFMVCDLYFQYGTTSQFLQDASDTLPPPDFSFCARYPELLSTTVFKDPSEATTVGRDDEFFTLIKLFSEHTVKELFDLTPKPEDLIEKCYQRDPSNPHTVVAQIGQNCMNLFEIEKYYMQEYICYRTKLKNKTPISFTRVAHSLFFGNTFFILVLNPVFANAYAILPIVYNGHVPLVSRRYAPSIVRLSDYGVKNATIISNMYNLRYSWMEFRLRPYPYDTDCDPVVNQAKCLRSCIINKTVTQIGKLPFTEIIMEAVDMKHLDYNDLYEMRDNITRIEDDCDRKCNKRTCHYDYTGTHVQEALYYAANMTFIVKTPTSPLTIVSAEPRLSLTEFIVYLLGCVGTWFGVSAMSLNPISYIKVKNPTAAKKQPLQTASRIPYTSRHGQRKKNVVTTRSPDNGFSISKENEWIYFPRNRYQVHRF